MMNRLCVAGMVVVVMGMATTAAWGAGEGKVAEIAEVNSLEELGKAKAIQLENGWEVRLGISDGGKDAGPWKLLYCMASKAKADAKEEWNFTGPSEILGPVMFRVTGLGVLDLQEKAVMVAGMAAKEGLYCGEVMTAWRGKWRVEVYEGKKKLIATRDIEVKDATEWYWQTAGMGDEKLKELVKEGEAWPMSRDSFAAAPGYSGSTPIWTEKEARPAARDGKTELPGKVDARSPWNALYMEKGRKGPEPLRLTMEKKVLVLRSDAPMLMKPQYNLLARWWVNGKAVGARRGELRKIDRVMGHLTETGK